MLQYDHTYAKICLSDIPAFFADIPTFAVIPAFFADIPAFAVIPTSFAVIPAKAGIHPY